MLIFDQLKKNDPQLRLLTTGVLAGILILVAGLWWVQIVSARDYQQHQETQAFRTVRIPAVRGKILDRNGLSIAENQAVYNVSLYLDDLRPDFDRAYSRDAKQQLSLRIAETEQKLNRKLSAKEKRKIFLSASTRNKIREDARYEVASNVVTQISQQLQKPLALDRADFLRHYQTRLALPYPVAQKIGPSEIARFEEQSTAIPGVDLEIQSTRFYPFENSAAHLLGYLRRDDSSMEGEESFFSYRLPDYRGNIGVEAGYDAQLRGRAGSKSVLVNNLGYRQNENVWTPAEPGQNISLTIDWRIQQAAEKALPVFGAATRGAAVVMDVQTGDILAMTSLPTFNPNHFLPSISSAEYQQIQNVGAEKNRATRENYAPGSIFKTVVAMACLENGLNPNAICDVQANPQDPNHGIVYVGRRSIKDTAPPGPYDFKKALIHSSNSYFIENGLKPGVFEKILQIGHRLHLGERFNLPIRQETSGIFPDAKSLRMGWTDGDTANLCIGQGYLDVTPLQMAVLASAIANGGKVLWPRLVNQITPQDPLSTEQPTIFPSRQVRDNLGVKSGTLEILRRAMLADVEDAEGTGKAAAVPGMRIYGKTGTAQIMNERNQITDHTTWFLSFGGVGAENPRYAVVIMVESGSSGGGTCAPIAKTIYEAILKTEQRQPATTVANN
jgi:penicillin-binding protein 2